MIFGEFLSQILERGLESIGLYYGVYKGRVKSVSDPDNLGRIQVHCPQVHGQNFPPVWAYPIAPYAGKQFGLWAIPDVGEWVYVRFDHGRPEFPLWCGGWWGDDDTTEDMTQKKVVLVTKEGLKIVLDRQEQSILVQQGDNSMKLSPDQISLKHASSVQVEAPSVTVQGDLSVTGDIAVQGDGNVNGTLTATNNSAHHTHPVVNGTAIRN